jgi:hypothetical protein
MAQLTELTRAAVLGSGRTDGRWAERWTAGVVFFACTGVLGVAAWLTPDSSGVGTHEQLHMAPCLMYQVSHVPCPTCGFTTSFALAAHGRLWAAIVNQPAGGLLALATAMAAVISAYAMVSGMSLAPLARRFAGFRWGVGFGLVLLAGWGYKCALTLGWLPWK